MFKNKLFLIFALGIFAIFGGVFLWTSFGQGGTIPPATTPIPTQVLPQEEKEATFFLSTPAAFAKTGENFPLEIKFKGEGLLLSGVAVRLTSKFDQTLPLEPKDADLQKEGIQAEANPAFLEKGWVYPVNKVWIDSENGMIIVELAVVNPMVTGFNAGPEENLATINFVAQASSQGLTFEFDPTQTKLITKEGREVRLNFEGGTYTIY